LIVLIIDARNLTAALVNRQLMSSGRTIAASRVDAAIVLIGQIKKPKFTCAS
jgi:hypothetical protein